MEIYIFQKGVYYISDSSFGYAWNQVVATTKIYSYKYKVENFSPKILASQNNCHAWIIRKFCIKEKCKRNKLYSIHSTFE